MYDTVLYITDLRAIYQSWVELLLLFLDRVSFLHALSSDDDNTTTKAVRK